MSKAETTKPLPAQTAAPRSAPHSAPHAAPHSASTPKLEFTDFLARLTAKDRLSAEKRVVALESSPDAALAGLWQRLACSLLNLAPFAAKLGARQVVQYFVADGKYRMQVFALEELDGSVCVYCTDVLAQALKHGVLVAASGQRLPENVYGIVGSPDVLRIESLDRTTIDPAAHFKDMIGWNRKAVRITLPPASTAGQVAATERLCALAAQQFAKPAAAAAAVLPTSPGPARTSLVKPRIGA